MTHNGWTNYETWTVKLWMDNEESICSICSDFANDIDDTSDLAKRLQRFVEEEWIEIPDNGLAADLINSALSEVNWTEIAEAFSQDLDSHDEEDLVSDDEENE